MIQIILQKCRKYDRMKCKVADSLVHFCESRKYILGMKVEGKNAMKPTSWTENPAVDVFVVCQTSPSHSISTLTPVRNRNIEQDMEALRLSRQDNPFLQVLASQENLVESIEESESDDVILMTHELEEGDPLTMAQVHEHLVRSPPPASWTPSSMFQFPQQSSTQKNDSENGLTVAKLLSPQKTENELTKKESCIDVKDRYSHAFSLLNPTPIRSLSEVRRLHRSADDSIQLMSSK